MDEPGHEPRPRTADPDGDMGNTGAVPTLADDPLFGPLPGPTVPPRLSEPPPLPRNGRPTPGGTEPVDGAAAAPEAPATRTPGASPVSPTASPDVHDTSLVPIPPPISAAASRNQHDAPATQGLPRRRTPPPDDELAPRTPSPTSPATARENLDDVGSSSLPRRHPTTSFARDDDDTAPPSPSPESPKGFRTGDEHLPGRPTRDTGEWDVQDDAQDDWDPLKSQHNWRAARRRLIRLVAIAASAAVAVTMVVVLVTRDSDEDTTPDSAPTTTTAPAVPSGFIDSAETDTDPVVAGEFFGTEQAPVSGTTYRRLAAQLDDGCPQLTGNLPTVLPDGRCRQLARALYVTAPAAGRRGVLTAVSVFVLDDKATAQTAVDAVTKGEGGVTPLAVPQGSVPGIAIASPAGDNSWRAATTRGHYMIFMQVAYADGSDGAATDDQLRNAIADMQLLAIEPISTRTITGHGPKPNGTTPASTTPTTEGNPQ